MHRLRENQQTASRRPVTNTARFLSASANRSKYTPSIPKEFQGITTSSIESDKPPETNHLETKIPKCSDEELIVAVVRKLNEI